MKYWLRGDQMVVSCRDPGDTAWTAETAHCPGIITSHTAQLLHWALIQIVCTRGAVLGAAHVPRARGWTRFMSVPSVAELSSRVVY